MFQRLTTFAAVGLLVAGSTVVGGDSAASAQATVELTWTQSQLGFLSNRVMAVNPPNVPAPPAVDGNVGSFRLASGNAGSSNRRDFWLHSQTQGWTNSRVFVEGIDPLYFGVHPTLGDVFPQGGVVLRFQSSFGKNRGITLNNNSVFFLPQLNVGVWEANPDGTGFNNRQTSFDFATHPPFPYGFEAILKGNIIRVRVFPMGQQPPSWDDTGNPWVRTINLDTDAGNASLIPTPTGPGTNGVIAAHQGTNPLSAVRLHTIQYERLG